MPLDRMGELANQGAIGSLGSNVYLLMGAQRPPYAALEANDAAVGCRIRTVARSARLTTRSCSIGLSARRSTSTRRRSDQFSWIFSNQKRAATPI